MVGAALQVQAPQIDTMAHFNASQEASQVNAMRKLQMAEQSLQTLGSIALATTGGNMDGQADPAMWDEAMDMLGEEGQKYKGRPEMAQVLARASIGALQQIQIAQNEEELDLALRKFEADLAAAQTAGQKAPQIETRYNPETGLEEKFEWNGSEWVPFGGQKAPAPNSGLSIRTNPDGTTEIVQGGNGLPPKMTEGQGDHTGWYMRGKGAHDALSSNEGPLADLVQQGLNVIPVAGNFFTSDEFKGAKRDAAEFLAVILRKDTGAAVTDKEFELYGPMYIPRPGDSPEQIERLRLARERALEAVRAGVGPGELLIQEREALGSEADGPVPAGEDEVVDWTDYL